MPHTASHYSHVTRHTPHATCHTAHALANASCACIFQLAGLRTPPVAAQVGAHQVQPTSRAAPITMAWVVDVDETCCGGNVDAILEGYEAAVLEVTRRRGM